MNNEDKKKVKIGILISSFSIVLYLALQNLDVVAIAISKLFSLLSAFLIGICIAFVLNLLMRKIEEQWFENLNKKKNKKWEKLKRPVSLLLTVIIFLGIIAALISFIIPQLVLSSKTLAKNIPDYIISLENFANNLLANWGVSTDLNQTITNFLADFSNKIMTYIGKAIPQIMESAKGITTGIVNSFLGFIVGIYMLSTKEQLTRNIKQLVYAFMPKKAADYTTHIYSIARIRFGGFVTGQLTEAFILGVLCFIGMNIFRMEYALLISVIIGLTNIVPIIGPILGAIPGTLIMLMINPMKAIWFVVFIIVLQQIESNLIYPKVVGDSIGLPGLWVIFAIMVGGNLFGFAGVILGVPTFAVIYALIAECTHKRLKEKKIDI